MTTHYLVHKFASGCHIPRYVENETLRSVDEIQSRQIQVYVFR